MPSQYIRIGHCHFCSNFIPFTFTNRIIPHSMTFSILLSNLKIGNKHTNIFQAHVHTIKAPEVSSSQLDF